MTTEGGRLLLDELQPRSSEQLHVPPGVTGETCRLKWSNSESWLAAITLSYTVRVVSMAGVKARLQARLHHAAEHGTTSSLQEALGKGIAVDALDAKGYTPLMRAALASRSAAVAALLAARASVDKTDRRGNQPLHLAAVASSDVACVKALLSGGADVHARNGDGATALALAAFRGHADVVSELLGAGADPCATDGSGTSALHLVAMAGHATLAKQLVGASASVLAHNQRGESAIRLAANAGHADVIDVLLRRCAADKTADANSDAGEGVRAALSGASPALLGPLLLSCCRDGAEQAALWLLDCGAALSATAPPKPPEQPHPQGPLVLASRKGCAPLVSLLLRRSAAAAASHGADGSARNTLRQVDCEEALDVAAALGHAAVVDAILAHGGSDASERPPADGADESHSEAARQRALYVAAGAGRTGLVLVLITGGADVKAAPLADGAEGSALHAAAAGGHTMTALTLLRHGCPLSALDARGRSALHLALERGHQQTAVALMRAAGHADTVLLLRRLHGLQCEDAS